MKDVEGIDGVFASKMVDVYCKTENGTTVVARVEEADRNVNGYELIAGRLPQKANEVVVLSSSVAPRNYAIGSTLSLYLESDDLSEKLENTEFIIRQDSRTIQCIE